MYRVIIEEVNEYEETTTAYRDPENPEKIYHSKYDNDSDEEVRDRLVAHKRPTGKMLEDSKQIFSQTVEKMDLKDVILAINDLK